MGKRKYVGIVLLEKPLNAILRVHISFFNHQGPLKLFEKRIYLLRSGGTHSSATVTRCTYACGINSRIEIMGHLNKDNITLFLF